MSSAAPAASVAEPQPAPAPRQAKNALTKRSGLQLLAGLLIVAGIPVVATVRILNSNALRNGRAHADAALQLQLQSAAGRLQGLSDNVSSRAEDLSRSPAVQRALLTDDRRALRGFSRNAPGLAFYVHNQRAAGSVLRPALTRSVSL